MEVLVVQLLLTLGLALLIFLAIFRLTTRNSRPAPTHYYKTGHRSKPAVVASIPSATVAGTLASIDPVEDNWYRVVGQASSNAAA